MGMSAGMRALVGRVLRQREAAGRAGLSAARQAQAACAAEEAGLERELARERAFAEGRRADHPLFRVADASWRDAAAARLAAARRRVAEADAACDAARDALAEVARTAKGFELLMARQDAERARREARREPLAQLMLLRRADRP